MREAHSYEEPAFDVYPMQASRGAWVKGRVGRLPAADSGLPRSAHLVDLAARVKTVLHANSLHCWVIQWDL